MCEYVTWPQWINTVPDIPWWRHQMETFSALLALCAGNSPVPVNSPQKGQCRGALMFSLIYAWINDWVNSREAGDLRRHRGHYDVIVMHKRFQSSTRKDLNGLCHPNVDKWWRMQINFNVWKNKFDTAMVDYLHCTYPKYWRRFSFIDE